MIRSLFAGLMRRTTRGSRRTTTTKRKRGVNERALRLEPLEGRALMAVTVVETPTYKDLEFSNRTANVSGNLSGKYGSSPVNGKFNGSFTLSSGLDYTSVVDATGLAGSIAGALKGNVYGYGALPTMTFDGDIDPNVLNEVAGKIAATLPDQGNITNIKLTGTLNVKNFSISGGISFKLYDTIRGAGSWSSNFAPDNPQPLTVTTTAAWDETKPGVLDINIETGGSVQKATTRATPVANVNLWWARADSTPISKLPDKIGILWNQKSGGYEVSNMPVPPAIAAKLLVITTWGTNTNTIALDLPSEPVVSISNASISPAATGFTDMVFTVTIDKPTDFPVVVRFNTVNGTAVKTQDFVAKSGSVTFTPGGSLTQLITIKVKRDATVANQDFFVQLAPPGWGTLSGSGRGTGTIVDIP